MATKIKNIINVLPLLATALAAVLFAACSSDEPDVPQKHEQEPEPVILFGGTRRTGVEWKDGRVYPRSAAPETRAEGDDVESVEPRDIGVFAFGSGQNTTYIFRNQKVYSWNSSEYRETPSANEGKFPWKYYGISDWPYTDDKEELISTQKPWLKMKYRFFAYSPWYETSKVSVTAENYEGFNSFTWDNIPGFSADDYMLSNEIHDCDNTEGTFTTAQNVVHFQMRHILSRIRFFFKMSPAYRTIRKIELDSLTVLTAGKVKTATFNFNSTLDWDGTVHWSNEQPGNAAPVVLESLTPNYEIPTEWPSEPFHSVYVYPQSGFNELRMRLSYTVYDHTGLPTRHAKVTNIISLPNWTLLSGYYYDIRINVVPKYLYVLSDNDQGFDGWVIIKDN